MADFGLVIMGWGIALIAGFLVRAVLNERDYKTGKKRRPITYDY